MRVCHYERDYMFTVYPIYTHVCTFSQPPINSILAIPVAVNNLPEQQSTAVLYGLIMLIY